MRLLKLNKNTPSEVPIPYYVGGEIDEHFLGFLTARYFYPDQVRERLSNILPSTLDNITDHISFLINIFEQGGITYKEATYENITEIIKALYEEEDWKGGSLKCYSASWRLFYEYLSKENVPHNMILPNRKKKIVNVRKDQQYLSHTPSSRDTRYVDENNLVPSAYCIYSDDYREKVISMDQWFQLYEYLYDEDPVYAVMAATMMQTFLRIGGVFQFPMAPTRGNPRWKRYAQLKQEKKLFQKLHYIKKGQKPDNCQVHIATMQMIDEEYLAPFFDERRELYVKKWLCSI